MSDIVIDGLHPNAHCLQPSAAAAKDGCEVEVALRRHGSPSQEGQVLTFRREKDRFFLSSNPSGPPAAFARGLGFSESSAEFQAILRQALKLHGDLEQSHLQFTQKNAGTPGRTPLLGRLRNFLVAGSIDSPDGAQRIQGNVLLREIFNLPDKERAFLLSYLKSLSQRAQALGLSTAMKNRVEWAAALLSAHEQTVKTLRSAFPIDDPGSRKDVDLLRSNLLQWAVSALVYLGTGEGEMGQLKARLDDQSIVLRRSLGVAYDDIYTFFLGKREYRRFLTLQGLEKSPVFLRHPVLKSRLNQLFSFLNQASRDGRALLLENSHDTFEKSVKLRVVERGRSGTLASFVQEELRSSHLSPTWLMRVSHIEEIADVISSAFKEVRREGTVEARLDLYRLKGGIERLILSHGIQEREFTIGTLAVLRSIFGRAAENLTLEVWVKDRYLPVRIDMSYDERRELKQLMQRLEWKVSTSLKRTQQYLPWIEGAICAAGLAVGGAGIGSDRHRGLTVGGSTGAGLGCGALLTHFIFRSRNPYIADGIGGAIGAGLGFGLSFFLTRPGRPTMMPPPPPPPPDLNGRNPTTGNGP